RPAATSPPRVWGGAAPLLFSPPPPDAAPQRNCFSLQNTDARTTNAIYVATLKKGTPSPLAKESDEEKGEAAAKDEKRDDKKDDGKDAKAAKKPPEPVVIDRDGIGLRIIDLPVHPAEISNLQAGSAGQIFFQRTADDKTSVQRFDFKDRKTETIVPEADDYYVSFDGKKILFKQKEALQKESPQKESWSIVASSGKKPDAKEGPDGKPKEGSDGKVKLDAIQVRVDPRAEWPEIFDEAWRVNRDYFYDPKMHGRDWGA